MKNSLEKNKIKKVIVNILRKVLKYIGIFAICVLIAYNILYLFNNIFRDKKYAQIFGLYISTEKEDNMSPEIQKNSLIIGIKINQPKQNQIVGYDIDNTLKYHRFVKIKNDNGKTTYITKADNNYIEDIEEKQLSDFKAKIVLKIPVIGWIFKIFESKITTIILIILMYARFSYNNYKVKLSQKRKDKKEIKP